MRLGAISASALLMTFALFSCDHGNLSDDEGSGGNGLGGSAPGTGGSAPKGGAPTGTGGAAQGGSGLGGAANGGSAGSAGGASLGGSTSGGSSNAGAANRGGSSSGGGGNRGGSTGNGGTTSSGGNGTGGSSVPQPPPITNGSNGWASRYWDCCKPACGWKGNIRTGNPMVSCDKQNNPLGSFDTKNACEGGGSAFMCWDASPWAVSDKLALGFAAASGGNYVCGRCYQIQFTGSGHSGNNPGASSLNGKTMILQVINNGGVQPDQFDILIPGGGVGALNACTNQWGSSDLGEQYGGFLAGCKGDVGCVKQKCQTVFSGKPDLQEGCDWFLGWYNAADNPNFVFKQIACPSEITKKSGLSDPG